MPIPSAIRSPLSDLTGTLWTHQYYGKCADLEMKTTNCFEAYGMHRAMTKCADIIEDFKECISQNKAKARIIEMRLERLRQIKNNERSKEDHYAPGPRPDCYQF